jgi:dihydroorotase
MPSKYHIVNALIVNEGTVEEGGLYLADGKIQAVYGKDGPPKEFHGQHKDGYVTIDAAGKYLLPGVIDDQVHFRDPGLTHKGDLQSESRAAIAGGVTSFMDMPNVVPQTLTQELLEQRYELGAEKSMANYSFYMGASNDNIGEILRTDPKHVCGIKVFMGASTGNMLVDDPEALERIFRDSKLLVAIHSENEQIIQENISSFRDRYGEDVPIAAHPLIRSEEACYSTTSLAVGLAKKHGTRLHVLHLSTAHEMLLFDDGIPLAEKRITSEVCVHHLWFSDRDYDELGAKIKWNPAIKTEADREALWQALLEDRLDIVATDHAPHTLEEKSRGYFKSPSGGPLVQHSLVAMLDFYHQGKITLERIVDKMCHHPAVCFHVEKRGYIREGYYGDLVLADLDDPCKVEPDNLYYKCGWSPFDGHTFKSKITHTFVNGNLVYEAYPSVLDGHFDESHRGMRMTFNR